MSILEGFGPAVEEIKEEEFTEKLAKISPFDFVNSINFTKQNLIIDERTENEYNPFIVNRGLGFNPDTVIASNEMNSRPHLDKKMQYDFLQTVVRKGKRYGKWLKSEEENLELIQKYFGYSFNKAKEALRILTDEQLEEIRRIEQRSKGGKL
jgi:hypothetical protein